MPTSRFDSGVSFGDFDVAVALQPAGPAARDQDRQLVVRMDVAVAHAAAVENHRVIQHVAVAGGHFVELRKEAGEHLHVIDIDLRLLFLFLRDRSDDATPDGGRRERRFADRSGC